MYDYALEILKRAQKAIDEELKVKVTAGEMTAPELAFNRNAALDIQDALDTLESIAADEPDQAQEIADWYADEKK